MTVRRAAIVLALFVVGGTAVLGRWIIGAQPEFVEYHAPRADDIPAAVAIAPDGAVWFTLESSDAVGVLRQGQIERVAIPGPLAQLGRLSAAPDGSVWFADSWGNSVTRLFDQRLEPHVAEKANAAPFGVAVQRDGVVWATLQVANRLMRIEPSGDLWYTDLSGWIGTFSAGQTHTPRLDLERMIAWLRG